MQKQGKNKNLFFVNFIQEKYISKTKKTLQKFDYYLFQLITFQYKQIRKFYVQVINNYFQFHMQIQANIRILPDTEQIQRSQSIFNEFYKKYQEFDAIFVNQDCLQSVEKLCQKPFENILSGQDICFVMFTNRKFNQHRRNSMKLEQEKVYTYNEQLELFKYCFNELKKKIEDISDQREKFIACSFVQLRKEIIKDLGRPSHSEKQTILTYHNNQNHTRITNIPIEQFTQIQEIYLRGMKLQEKQRSFKKAEPVSSILKLSIVEKSNQCILSNILFIDLSNFIKLKQSYEQQGILHKIGKLILNKQKLNLQHQPKIINYLEPYIKEFTRISLICYSHINGIQEQSSIFNFLNQLKKTRNRSQNNSFDEQQQTSSLIAKFNGKIAAVKAKMEVEKKDFKIKLRNIQSLIGTDFDIEKILNNSCRNQSNIFKKQRQAVDEIESVMKITQEQKKKISILNKEYNNIYRNNSSKQLSQFNEMKSIKRDIEILESEKKKMSHKNQRNRIHLKQLQANELQKLQQSRSKILIKHKQFVNKVNRDINVVKPLKKVDLKQYHDTLLSKYTQQNNKKLEKIIKDNQLLIKQTEQQLKIKLQKLSQQIQNSKQQPPNQKQAVLHTLYKQYKLNTQLLQQIQIKYIRNSNTKTLIDQAKINLKQYPILMEFEQQEDKQISNLKDLIMKEWEE